MCRNIKPLNNFEPPATAVEISAAALQFVRKISGCSKPAKGNEAAFNLAVAEVAVAATKLLDSLENHSAPKNRQEEAVKAKARSMARFGG